VTGSVRPGARSLWIAQMALGSAMLAGGVGWHISANTLWAQGHVDTNEYLDTSRTEKFHRPILISAALAGLGAGLLPGALTGLVLSRSSSRKIRRSYAVRPATSGTYFGLRVSGAF